MQQLNSVTSEVVHMWTMVTMSHCFFHLDELFEDTLSIFEVLNEGKCVLCMHCLLRKMFFFLAIVMIVAWGTDIFLPRYALLHTS